MSWRDNLQKASFRSVSFGVVAADTSLGRRTVLHQYPLRDRPYAEDLGRQPREYTLECFVLGDDYFAARDALLRAFEAQGPGILIHPYLGSKRVSVASARLIETAADGRMARFVVAFVESGERDSPTTVPDTRGLVGIAADNASQTAQDLFSGGFSLLGLPSYVFDGVITLVQETAVRIRSVTGAITAATQPINDFSDSVEQLTSEVITLIQQPKQLASQFGRVISSVVNLFQDPLKALKVYEGLNLWGDVVVPVPLTTSNRVRQAEQQRQVVRLVETLAATEGARASASTEFESYDQAVDVRAAVAAMIDRIADTAEDPQIYQDMVKLRAAMVSDINARGANLARVISHTPTMTLPALVIVHRLYGDANRQAEIVSRNRIRHPGFVQGGRALEVLSNDA